MAVMVSWNNAGGTMDSIVLPYDGTSQDAMMIALHIYAMTRECGVHPGDTITVTKLEDDNVVELSDQRITR